MRTLKELMRYNPRSTSKINDELFVKTSSELSLANEAHELIRCKELSIAASNVSPLELIEFNAQHNQLTTKLVPNGISLYNSLMNGTSLFRFMRKERLDSGLVLARMEEIGRWLKLYHDTTTNTVHCCEALENSKRLYSEKIGTVRQFGILKEEFLQRIKDRFVPQIEKAADSSYQQDNFIRFCRLQGDFAVGNMLVDPNWHIYVSDFADSRIGASLEDVVRFYEQLWAMSRTNRHRGRLLSRALQAFLHGYGAPLGIEETPFFKALIAYNGLISCITEFTTAPYIKYQIMTRFELKRLKNATLRWISAEIENSRSQDLSFVNE
jgi:hypothetical protein